MLHQTATIALIDVVKTVCNLSPSQTLFLKIYTRHFSQPTVIITCQDHHHRFNELIFLDFSKFLKFIVGSGVASMEQMEQLLPRNAKSLLCNSRRSEEIFRGRGWGFRG